MSMGRVVALWGMSGYGGGAGDSEEIGADIGEVFGNGGHSDMLA